MPSDFISQLRQKGADLLTYILFPIIYFIEPLIISRLKQTLTGERPTGFTVP